MVPGHSRPSRPDFTHGVRQLAQSGLQIQIRSGQHRDAVPIFDFRRVSEFCEENAGEGVRLLDHEMHAFLCGASRQISNPGEVENPASLIRSFIVARLHAPEPLQGSQMGRHRPHKPITERVRFPPLRPFSRKVTQSVPAVLRLPRRAMILLDLCAGLPSHANHSRDGLCHFLQCGGSSLKTRAGL